MTEMEITMTQPKRFKMNWGWGITGVYLVFVIGILYMVWRTTQERVDLVSDDYYAQEIRYQEKIDASKRAAALSSPVRFELSGQTLHLSFPKEFEGKAITGDVLFYYPADSRKDVTAPVKLQNNMMELTVKAGSPGMHILQVSWKEGNTTYYQESNLTMP